MCTMVNSVNLRSALVVLNVGVGVDGEDSLDRVIEASADGQCQSCLQLQAATRALLVHEVHVHLHREGTESVSH